MNRLLIVIIALAAMVQANAQKKIDEVVKNAIKSVEISGDHSGNTVSYELKRNPKTKKVEYNKVIMTVTDKKLGRKLESAFRDERNNADEVKVIKGEKGADYRKLIFRQEKGYREYILTGGGDSWSLIVRSKGTVIISDFGNLNLNGLNESEDLIALEVNGSLEEPMSDLRESIRNLGEEMKNLRASLKWDSLDGQTTVTIYANDGD